MVSLSSPVPPGTTGTTSAEAGEEPSEHAPRWAHLPEGSVGSSARGSGGRICRKAVSVWKVVPTLTSNKRWDLPLDGWCLATKDTWFILVPAGAVRPAGVCSRHCIASHRGACRGVATSEAGEEVWPPSPKGCDWGECQYRGEGGERVSDRYPSSRPLAARGITSLL
jgi:hypothetical protein